MSGRKEKTHFLIPVPRDSIAAKKEKEKREEKKPPFSIPVSGESTTKKKEKEKKGEKRHFSILVW